MPALIRPVGPCQAARYGPDLPARRPAHPHRDCVAVGVAYEYVVSDLTFLDAL